jgi:hypothetical protein
MPLIIYDNSGGEVWNSDTVSGGVIATIKSYASTSTDTLTFPAFAGRSAQIVNLLTYVTAGKGSQNVTLDFALGYPRVTVATSSAARKFALVVY